MDSLLLSNVVLFSGISIATYVALFITGWRDNDSSSGRSSGLAPSFDNRRAKCFRSSRFRDRPFHRLLS